MNLISISVAVWSSLVGPQDQLTLEEAIRIAENNSFAIQIAESNVIKTRERINEAASAAGLKLNAAGTYTRFDRATTENFGGSTVVVSPIDQKQAQLTLTFPIDIFGTIRKAVAAARAAEKAQVENVETTRNDLRLSVRNAFFTVLQTRSQVALFEESLSRAKAQLANARLEFEKGARARVDVLRFETQVSQAESDLLVSQNALALAKNVFNNVLGRPIQTPFTLATPEQGVKPVPEPDNLVATALAKRPEIRFFEFQIRGLIEAKRYAEGGLKPSLSLNAVHTRNIDAQGFSARDSSTTGTLALNLPIFDGGLTRARVGQAREDVRQAELQFEQLKLGISLEVRQALTNLENADARLKVAESQVALAQQTYDISLVRDKVGEGISLQVIDAQTELTRAKTNLIAAQYDYHKAYAALQKALGTDAIQ